MFRRRAKKIIEGSGLDDSGGFTFLEIMVALVILGSVVITVVTSLNYHIGVVERNKTMTVASMLADEKLEEIMTMGAAERQGRFSGGFEKYSWSYSEEEAPYPGVKKVYLTVSWSAKSGGGIETMADKGESVTIETYERQK